jgi:hypothetical protein
MTTLVWETIDGPAAAITPRWQDRKAATLGAGAADAVLFEVVEGVGSFVAVYLFTDGDHDRGTEKLSGDQWCGEGALRAGPVRLYHQVFASADARPYSGVDDRMFAVNADIDPPDPEEFERWYNETHVPDVGGAGLVRARRFHGVEESWKYFATYELASHDVMESEALKRVRGFHQYTQYVQGIQRTVMAIQPE